MPRTLADEAETDLGVALMRTAFVMRQVLQRRLRDVEPRLSPAEFAVLHMLSLADGQRVGELADASIRDRTTLTRIADRMVGKRLIERRTDDGDRRAVLLFITALGRRVHDRLLPLRHALVETVTAHVSDRERTRMIRALVTMRARLVDELGDDA